MKGNIIKLAFVLLSAAVLSSCGRTEIDPNDYLAVRFSGLDTAASADYDIDCEKMVKDNLRAFRIKEEGDEAAISRAAERLEENLSCIPDRDTMLSNGDIITFAWDGSGLDELEKSYKIRLSLIDREVTVSGLEEAEPFDPFDFLSIDYCGTEPGGTAVLSCEDMPVKGIGFTADKSSGLNNGDRIKISFGSGSEEEIKDACFAQGYIPSCFEREYTVAGLQHYITKLSSISRDSYNKMDSYTQAEFRKLAGTWKDRECTDIQLLGAELYTPAEGEAKWGRNALCFIYEVTAEIKKDKKPEKKETVKYFYFTYFLNTVAPDKEEQPFPAECAVFPSYSEFYTSIYGDAFKVGDIVFEGYRTLDELESALADCFENSACETDINNEE